ncbi:MAG: PEP-CTERM sorting domain-containing protein [Sedimentisphaerales bacterium]
MKRRSHIFLGLRAIILAAVVILVSLGGSAYCQTEGVSLLLQQIPAQGGTITPSVGVHHLKPNSEITLTANPRPGYQFIGWLGDVSDPKASSTVAYINGPKIIIALFERTEYENLPPQTSSAGGGGSGASGSASGGSTSFFANPSGLMIGGGGGGKPKVPLSIPRAVSWPINIKPSAPKPTVPEPATMILLALGSLFTFARRSVKRQA